MSTKSTPTTKTAKAPKAAKNAGVKAAATEKVETLRPIDMDAFNAVLAERAKRGRAPINWDAIVLGLTPGQPQVISPSGKTVYKSTTGSHPSLRHLRDAAERNGIKAHFVYDAKGQRLLGLIEAPAAPAPVEQ